MLLKLMESPNPIVMIAALKTLSKIIRSSQMKSCWIKFLELILIKIIDSYKLGKEVSPVVIFQESAHLLWNLIANFGSKYLATSKQNYLFF